MGTWRENRLGRHRSAARTNVQDVAFCRIGNRRDDRKDDDRRLRLLARAVFVVDRQGTVQYIQLVKEVSEEPDYDAVLEAVKKLV